MSRMTLNEPVGICNPRRAQCGAALSVTLPPESVKWLLGWGTPSRRGGPNEAERAGRRLTWKSMARGWESKSVEAQMETAQSKQEETARKRLTPEGPRRCARRKHCCWLAPTCNNKCKRVSTRAIEKCSKTRLRIWKSNSRIWAHSIAPRAATDGTSRPTALGGITSQCPAGIRTVRGLIIHLFTNFRAAELMQ